MRTVMAVPEATMHENDRAPAWQDDVGCPRQMARMQCKSQAAGVKVPAHGKLGERVLLAHLSHQGGTLGCGRQTGRNRPRSHGAEWHRSVDTFSIGSAVPVSRRNEPHRFGAADCVWRNFATHRDHMPFDRADEARRKPESCSSGAIEKTQGCLRRKQLLPGVVRQRLEQRRGRDADGIDADLDGPACSPVETSRPWRLSGRREWTVPRFVVRAWLVQPFP